MPNSIVTLNAPGSGKDPVRLVDEMLRDAKPGPEDLLYAVERQKTRILERTERGVDFEGKPFAPYSTKGRYYFYPSMIRGKAFLPALKQLERIHSGKSTFRKEYFTALRNAATRFRAKIAFAGRVTEGGAIVFAGYAGFKGALGRTVVDLLGPRAPHMLQAMVTKSRGAQLEAAIGIYGPEADRAEGHNEGNPKTKLPKRRFLDANKDDEKAMAEDVADQVAARVGAN